MTALRSSKSRFTIPSRVSNSVTPMMERTGVHLLLGMHWRVGDPSRLRFRGDARLESRESYRSVHEGAQDPILRFPSCRSFGFEWISDHGDGHGALFFCQSCDMACRSSTGTTSHTCSDDCKLCIGGMPRSAISDSELQLRLLLGRLQPLCPVQFANQDFVFRGDMRSAWASVLMA